MTFKKGDKIRTEDGHTGEILFIDKNGLEAQVALARVSVKLRTDTLKMFKADEAPAAGVASPAKKKRVRSAAK